MGVLDGLMTMDEAVRIGIAAFAFSSLYFQKLMLSKRIYQLEKQHKASNLFEVRADRFALIMFTFVMIYAMSVITGIVEAKPESDDSIHSEVDMRDGTATCQTIALGGVEYVLEGCDEIGVE